MGEAACSTPRGLRSSGPSGGRERSKSSIHYVLLSLFVFSFTVFLITAPHNQTDLYDGYNYAFLAETVPIDENRDSRAILFHAFNRAAFVLSLRFGERGFAEVIQITTGLSAALAISLMARLLIRGLGTSIGVGVLGGLSLAFSYGFWRYATAIEVYVPSIFFILAVLNLLFHCESAQGPKRLLVVPAGVLAGLAVLHYQPSFIPLFLAAPILFLSRGRLRYLVCYAGVGFSVVLSGYVIFYQLAEGAHSLEGFGLFLTHRNREFGGFFVSNLIKSPIAMFRDLFCLNWLYALDHLPEIPDSWYPHERDEMTFAARAFRPYSLLPLFIAPLLALSTVLGMRLMAWGQDTPKLDRRLLLFMSWIGIYALIVIYLDGRHPEHWILALPPLVVIASVLVFERLERAGKTWLVGAFVALVASYNFFGGIGIVSSERGDLYRQKTAWLRENRLPSDVVWLPGAEHKWPFISYLRYVVGVDVVVSNLERSRRFYSEGDTYRDGSLESLLVERSEPGGRLFVFEEFLSPNAFNRRSSLNFAYLVRLADRLREQVRVRHAGAAGMTLEIVASEAELNTLLGADDEI